MPARDAIVRPLSRAAERPCARPGCPSPARSTLDFSYATRTALLRSLSEERSPQSYDLCANHADRTTPPHGWDLHDERADDDVDDGPITPGDLDGPRTVAVLAAALRGEPDDDLAAHESDPLREALEELQAVSAVDDAPAVDARPLRIADRADAGAEVEELDLEALTAILAGAEVDVATEPPAEEQIELLTLALEDVVDAAPVVTDVVPEPGSAPVDPGRPVLAHRTRETDDEGRATLW